MTNPPKRTKTGRMLTVMVAVSLLAAACASDPSDSAADELPPDTAEPTTATSAGDAEPDPDVADAAGAGTDDDPASAPDERVAEDPSEETPSSDEPGTDEADTAVTAAALRQFGECDAVLSYVQEHAAQAVGPWGLDDGFGIAGEVLEAEAAADDAASVGAGSLQPGVDYSTSNVQEAGIDEPHVLKTDGRRMVVASENRVHVVDVTGPAPVLVATLEIGDHWISNLLLHGDRVLVFASQWDVIVPFAEPGDTASEIEPTSSWGPTTGIVEIDLASTTPRVTRRLDIEGDYVGARLTDGVVRVVTTSRPRAIHWAVPETADLGAQERSAGINRDLIAGTTLDDWLPRFVLNDASGTAVAGGRLVDCGRVWAPPHYAGPGTLSVTTIDIAADGLAGAMDTTTIMSDGSTVYASHDHLYVTTTRWHDWGVEPAGPGDGTPVETEIHMFDTSGRATSTYVGSASVTGTVLNQYSMSEHEGHLRIATTTAQPWWTWRAEVAPESESLVTVLAVGPDGLAEVGRVDGLGVGERIFAVRYLGDIAAVVTFRQIDPLYLLDLSDPTAPAVRGELKITGYSAYLHPLGDDLLLGVGQEATDEGFTVGTQVSLFDIADLDRPERIAQWTAPGGHSQVEFNALAFLHWQPSELAVLPLNQYPFDDSGSEPPFLGAVALGTAGAELTERARLSHADPPVRKCRESREILVRPDGTEEPGPWERYCWFDTDWQAQVTASAVVGDRLYLASHRALESVWLESLERASLLTWAR
ncbi:MAG: benzoate transporter [Acidimicrobiales bacterium]|nr:benzoate transporter [Acidimicrobiales bacterium]MYH73582.1 benzoate transporter [Acidimicrobiales bacterium]MYK72906.1 benzoate transporter [Acidimicrobiales bacterium]